MKLCTIFWIRQVVNVWVNKVKQITIWKGVSNIFCYFTRIFGFSFCTYSLAFKHGSNELKRQIINAKSPYRPNVPRALGFTDTLILTQTKWQINNPGNQKRGKGRRAEAGRWPLVTSPAPRRPPSGHLRPPSPSSASRFQLAIATPPPSLTSRGHEPIHHRSRPSFLHPRKRNPSPSLSCWDR